MSILLKILAWLPAASLVLGVVIGVFVVRICLKRNSYLPFLIYFPAFVLSGILLIEGGAAIARWHVRRQLDSMSAEPYTLTIQGKKIKRPAPYVNALRTLSRHRAHHSSPWQKRPIVIRLAGDNSTLDLVLREDSDVRGEYWVFIPAFSNDSEVGSINSAAFAKFE